MNRFVKSIILLLLFLIVTDIIGQTNRSFIYVPARPKPGDKISFAYEKTGSSMEKAASPAAVIRVFGKDLLYTVECELKNEGTKLTGCFVLPDTCAGAVICISDGDVYDKNHVECCPIRLYGNDDRFIKYASSGLAYLYTTFVRTKEGDISTSCSLYEEELTLHPEVKDDIIVNYAVACMQKDKTRGEKIIKEVIAEYELSHGKSEKALGILMKLYYIIRDDTAAEKVKKKIFELYPLGSEAEIQQFNEVLNTKELSKKAELFEKFKSQFPKSQDLTFLASEIDPTKELISSGKFDQAYKILKKIEKPSSTQYNNLALAMYLKGSDLKLAKEIAEKGLTLAVEEAKNPFFSQQPYMTEKDYKKAVVKYYFKIYYTYGIILLKLGENKSALKYLELARESEGTEQVKLNIQYAQALAADDRYNEASEILESDISSGRGIPEMKDVLRMVYTKRKGSEEGFEEYYTQIESIGKNITMEDINRNLVNKPALSFTLKDLNGKTVTLDDFRGKTVILDFWASWCGSCKASFPSMKKAVEKYSNNNNVKFVFIDTFEKGDNKTENAAEFIKENNYPFYVLSDTDSKAAISYGVKSIPTKVFIDKEGNIRYQAVGFDEATIQKEIDMVINAIK
jgi:thiol-disulfide isomerase/thioredoxin